MFYKVIHEVKMFLNSSSLKERQKNSSNEDFSSFVNCSEEKWVEI